MKSSSATLDSSGGPVNIRITIGKRQLGLYIMELFDPQTGRSQKVKKGNSDNNSDNMDETLTVQSPERLIGKRLFTQVIIFKQTDQIGDRYFVTMEISQDGRAVTGGVLEEKDSLDATVGIVLGYEFI